MNSPPQPARRASGNPEASGAPLHHASTNVDWLWGWVFGMLLHLPLDIVFNGKFASSGLVHFYSFIVRARAGFRADRFTDRPRRPVSADGFLAAFFKGGQVADGTPTGPAEPVRS